ncbi:MAG TPA: GNVR domain-containing protein [Terracidiphilus sp.]|nr:GNVR domain-containing protein [Terracidiphilus sp.]
MATETQAHASAAKASAAISVASPEVAPNWLRNLRVLWQARVLLGRITCIAFVVSLAIAFLIPKMYISQARIMPPEMSDSNSTLLAALAGRTFGSDALGGLALGLMGGRNNGALFVDLLQSGTVSSRIIDRFQLQSVYRKRYRVDTAKVLARRTHVTQDKKSGVLTLSVRDTDPARARNMTQAYLDELNILVNRTSSSSARQERIFIEKRLAEVKDKLMEAQNALSDFSSSHAAIDLKEQARATVESEAKVQGELIAAQSELESLRQVYGDANVRVRASEARIASLRSELAKIGGSPALPAATSSSDASATTSYLPLRQVPRLAVPFANLYREVHVQETVYDLLIQQYEIARLQEAKDIPVVRIIDAPGIPEKKSFPPRTVLTFASTLVILFLACCVLLVQHQWLQLDPQDARRAFAREVSVALHSLPFITKRS